MNIVFELIDKEDEPLISLPGNEYIPPIGTMVYFYNQLYDEELDDEATIERTGIVESYYYSIDEDALHIYCKDDIDIDDEKNKHHLEEIRKYNTLQRKLNKK